MVVEVLASAAAVLGALLYMGWAVRPHIAVEHILRSWRAAEEDSFVLGGRRARIQGGVGMGVEAEVEYSEGKRAAEDLVTPLRELLHEVWTVFLAPFVSLQFNGDSVTRYTAIRIVFRTVSWRG